MAQAIGKEQSRRKRREVALLENPAPSTGRIPAKVSVHARAIVAAGLAKEPGQQIKYGKATAQCEHPKRFLQDAALAREKWDKTLNAKIRL